MREKFICKCGKSVCISKVDQKICPNCNLELEKKVVVANNLLKRKSSLLHLIDIKKKQNIRLKCLTCRKVTSGIIKNFLMVCSNCFSNNIICMDPIFSSYMKKGRSGIKEYFDKYKAYCKLENILNSLFDNLSIFGEDIVLNKKIEDLLNHLEKTLK